MGYYKLFMTKLSLLCFIIAITVVITILISDSLLLTFHMMRSSYLIPDQFVMFTKIIDAKNLVSFMFHIKYNQKVYALETDTGSICFSLSEPQLNTKVLIYKHVNRFHMPLFKNLQFDCALKQTIENSSKGFYFKGLNYILMIALVLVLITSFISLIYVLICKISFKQKNLDQIRLQEQ